MNNSIFIFTFSPVQAFISEARRAADLYTGSQILVELAKAAAEAIGKDHLIYPALDEQGNLPADIPNKLVANIPFEDCEETAQKAETALRARWKVLATNARENFKFQKDQPFVEEIWQSQIERDDYLWEIYWTASALQGRTYTTAYQEAENALIAVKFTRLFPQTQEEGFKDTLSGKRRALHSKENDGRKYWQAAVASGKFTPAKLRPGERLDSIGLVKRFRDMETETKEKLKPFYGFPSTSSVASADFLQGARQFIKNYKSELEKLGAHLNSFTNIREDRDFPYDGDLLYLETLVPKRLKDDHRVQYSNGDPCSKEDLSAARQALTELYKVVGAKPSPYYAIIVLDGDGMGEHLRELDEQGHRDFSKYLREFSQSVPELVGSRGFTVYNGGDDVLVFAPLSEAIPLARILADNFHQKTGRTASAGIALSHHLSPLGTALRKAREAEQSAKKLPGKNSVSVFALKRSGEPIQVRSGWKESEPLEKMIELFNKDQISSRLPYDIARSAYALPNADEKFQSDLRRLIKRHWLQGKEEEKDASSQALSQALHSWAMSFPKEESPTQTESLANWLALARFIAKGGRE